MRALRNLGILIMKYTVEIVGVSLAAFLALVGGGTVAGLAVPGTYVGAVLRAGRPAPSLLLRQHSFMPAAPAPARSSVHSEVEYMDGPIRFGVGSPPCSGPLSASWSAWSSPRSSPGRSSISSPGLPSGGVRPLHTSAVVFAFGGNALITTSFWVVQRTSHARACGAAIWPGSVFWGYQLFIVLAASGYVLGITQSRELRRTRMVRGSVADRRLAGLSRRLPRHDPEAQGTHIYVANWFYLAFIVTIAMLHVVNNMAVPVSFLGAKSYSAFSGVQDALTQWWYGHNAVGFFLTAGFLGIMYYFVPKQANRPIYSYRLSIISLLGA